MVASALCQKMLKALAGHPHRSATASRCNADMLTRIWRTQAASILPVGLGGAGAVDGGVVDCVEVGAGLVGGVEVVDCAEVVDGVEVVGCAVVACFADGVKSLIALRSLTALTSLVVVWCRWLRWLRWVR